MPTPRRSPLRNADGQGDFFDGLQPNCRAADDIGHQLGDPLESSLHEALTVIATGPCWAASTAPAAFAPGSNPPASVSGWQSLVGAN